MRAQNQCAALPHTCHQECATTPSGPPIEQLTCPPPPPPGAAPASCTISLPTRLIKQCSKKVVTSQFLCCAAVQLQASHMWHTPPAVSWRAAATIDRFAGNECMSAAAAAHASCVRTHACCCSTCMCTSLCCLADVVLISTNRHPGAQALGPSGVDNMRHATRITETAQLDEQGNTHLPTYHTHQDTDHSSRTDAHPCHKSGCCWQASSCICQNTHAGSPLLSWPGQLSPGLAEARNNQTLLLSRACCIAPPEVGYAMPCAVLHPTHTVAPHLTPQSMQPVHVMLVHTEAQPAAATNHQQDSTHAGPSLLPCNTAFYEARSVCHILHAHAPNH